MSKIQWTESTWNPTVGCSLKSPGCTNCYAMSMAARIESMGGKAADKYAGTTKKVNGNAVWTGMVRLDPAALPIPLKWRKPRLIFVNSMSDLFHESLPWSTTDRVFAVMALAGEHTFQLLTKRPERMRDYLADPETERRVRLQADMIRPGSKIEAWPLRNVWCGTSVEDQTRADERIAVLLATKAYVRFLSIEPLLGPVTMVKAASKTELSPGEDRSGIHWVIVGGESGHKARPMHPDWARSLRDEALRLRIPFFFKQFGQWGLNHVGGKRTGIGLMTDGSRLPVSTPAAVTLWNVGKKNAGELLDGQIWHQFPSWTIPAPTPRRKQVKPRRSGPSRELPGDQM